MEDYGSFSTQYLFIAFSDANGTVVDDDWNVKWVLMQDGFETVVYEPEDGWITHTVPMNSLKRTKRYREEVMWPKNCPAPSATVPGIADRCYHMARVDSTLRTAVDYCSKTCGPNSSLISFKQQDYIANVSDHYNLAQDQLFWVDFAKIKIYSGLNILKDYYWADLKNFQPIDYDSIVWYDGEPRKRDNELCGCSRGGDGGKMHDCYCHGSAYVICEVSDPSIMNSTVYDCWW
ncbi:uncharacterized protein LOC142353415 [Convolutriloba macropyga]|uniref:uncharacterized protein LOC142353415 n=1 Tax=Convolutriloba macropyga TaxID=536237 RepID=UPI003F51DD56